MKPSSPALAALLALACTPRPEPRAAPEQGALAAPEPLAITGGRIRLADGTLAPRTLHLAEGKIRAIDQEPAAPGERAVEVGGATLLPAFIDSHVHITFSSPEAELGGGIAAAIDFGAPPRLWEEAPRMLPFRLYPVGQLLTAPGGYPTRGWGADGYGREVRGVADARAAVEEVAGRGAKAVKMPLEPSGPLLSAEEQRAIVEAAHARGLVVGSHALSAGMVKLALAAGVDLLVHAPVERLDEATIAAFCGRPRAAVIPTLSAFGASRGAVDNVKRLRAAGCAVLYGTDLGNGVPAGIIPGELAEYVALGMSPAEVIDSATRAPAAYFGLDDLGDLSVGKAASLIAVPGDPYTRIEALEELQLVIVGGQIFKQ